MKKYSSVLDRFTREIGLEILLDKQEEELRSLFHRVQSALDSAQNKYILEHIKDTPGLMIAIYKGRYVYANEYLLKAAGYSPEELYQLKPEDLVAEEHREIAKNVAKRRLKGERFRTLYSELKFKTKDNRILYALVFANTIVYDGEYAGLVVGIDITKRKRLELVKEVLKEAYRIIAEVNSEEELYRSICKVLLDKLGLKLVWVGEKDEKTKRVLPVFAEGTAKEYLKEIEVTADGYSPTSKGPTGTCFNTGEVIINEDTRTAPLMEPWKDTALRYGLLSSASIPVFKNGKVVKVISLYSGEAQFFVDEIKEALQELVNIVSWGLAKIELLRGQIMLSEALGKAPYYLFITDEKGIIQFANAFAQRKLNAKEGIHLKDVIPIPEIVLEKVDFKASSPVTIRINLPGEEGNVVYLEVTLFPILISDNRKNLLIVARDVTQEVALLEEIEQLRNYDTLTGLLNERGFITIASEILNSHPDQIAALLLIDIHDLKTINSVYGHETGDHILKAIGKRLRQNVKTNDLIFRMHGDRFGVFLLNLPTRDEIAKVITRILQGTFSEPIYKDDTKFFLNYHAGIAVYPDDGKMINTLLRHAAAAVDESKKIGTNQIYFFNKRLKDSLSGYLPQKSW